MPLDLGEVPTPVGTLEVSLADLWARTASGLEASGRAEFRRAVETMIEGWLWELHAAEQNRVPDPVDYVEMRRATFGADMTMSLARLTTGRLVPDAVYASRPVRELEDGAVDAACFINDLFSYQKEVEVDGEFFNCVVVVEEFLECPRDEAVGVVADLIRARLEQFELLASQELPAVADEFGLDDDARGALDAYVQGLRDWVAAILNWHVETSRYREEELAPLPSFGPGAVSSGGLPRHLLQRRR